jgi:hypothetical protein
MLLLPDKVYYSLRFILIEFNMDVSRTKICLDTMNRREYFTRVHWLGYRIPFGGMDGKKRWNLNAAP